MKFNAMYALVFGLHAVKYIYMQGMHMLQICDIILKAINL